MKKTELVFILDRSGSMSGLEAETIGGYNSMLKKQQAEAGDAVVTTVLFDHDYEIVHDRSNIQEIKPLTEKDYFVRGSTALLDAVGMTINKIVSATRNTKKEFQADKVMFVIITDGMENSSCEYTYKKVKAMIDLQKEKYNWEFVFLGANIDAIDTAAKFGIDKDMSVNYMADSAGTELNYSVVGDLVVNYRRDRKVDKDWKDKIEKDYKERK